VSILSRLLGYPTLQERAGARLNDRDPWVVPATRDAAAMLRALPTLLPGGGFVYFEDTTEAVFASWLQAHAVPAPLKVADGTIWPKPDVFHVPLEPALLEEAAVLIEQHRIALPSIHIHAHDGAEVLLQWHDAFIRVPMYVDSKIPRERVDAFARLIGVGPISRWESAG